MANTIDPSLYLSTYQASTRTTGSSTLGKDDFLKILIAQLQNQDPTNPMQDKDFIAQMATFSSLEQMTNMNKALEGFISEQKKTSMFSYQQLIGKEVAFNRTIEGADGQSAVEQDKGIVNSIQYKNGQLLLTLADGTAVGLEDISEVQLASSENYMIQASQLIGKTVTWMDQEGRVLENKIESVLFKNGKASFVLAGETNSITFEQITKLSS